MTNLRCDAVGELATLAVGSPDQPRLWTMVGAYAGKPLRFWAFAHPSAPLRVLADNLQGSARPPYEIPHQELST